jgi:hypothetical protein
MLIILPQLALLDHPFEEIFELSLVFGEFRSDPGN